MYFQKFPSVFYDIEDTDTFRIAKDILKRFTFTDNIKSNAAIYQTYTIREGDLPETLAFRLYGSAEYHWIILLMNDILDPYFEWPLNHNKFVSYLGKKYPGQAFFLDNIINGVTGFSAGEIITTTGATGTVVSWDRSLSKLVVDNITGTFSVADVVTGAGSGITGALGRVVAVNRESVHHFADATGNYLDPLSNPNGVFVGQQDSGVTVVYTDTNIENYINSSTDTFVITNREYEDDQNEKRREIKILKPEFVSAVSDELNNVIKNG